jgi:hypothetical protein
MGHMHYLYETCAIAYGRRALPLFTELPTKMILGNQKPGFRELWRSLVCSLSHGVKARPVQPAQPRADTVGLPAVASGNFAPSGI